MYSSLRSRFGIPGVIAVVALVFAMMGGAYAASGGLSAKQKKEVKAIAKSFQGSGPAGAVGPAGPVGSKGKDGVNGEIGGKGLPGPPGAAGESVISAPITPGPTDTHCNEQGGSEFEVEESAVVSYACNGKDGSPWTAGGTLPEGATETGTWTFNGTDADTAGIDVSISFPIPLEEEVEEGSARFVPVSAGSCAGSLILPTAPKGKLCVYAEGLTNSTFKGIFTLNEGSEAAASTMGALMRFSVSGVGVARGHGSWAVTG